MKNGQGPGAPVTWRVGTLVLTGMMRKALTITAAAAAAALLAAAPASAEPRCVLVGVDGEEIGNVDTAVCVNDDNSVSIRVNDQQVDLPPA